MGISKWEGEAGPLNGLPSPPPTHPIPYSPFAIRESVQLERVLVIELERRILRGLVEDAVADHERLDFRPHEAAERILDVADDRLAAHVEAGIDQHRTAGELLEAAEQRVIARVGLAMHGLHPRRIIHVR